MRDFATHLPSRESRTFRWGPDINSGAYYELPPELPYDVVLMVEAARLEDGDDAPLTSGLLWGILTGFYGEERVDEWRSQGLGLTRLTPWVEWAFTVLDFSGTVDADDTDQVEVPTTPTATVTGNAVG